jgi:hypothetical protein
MGRKEDGERVRSSNHQWDSKWAVVRAKAKGLGGMWERVSRLPLDRDERLLPNRKPGRLSACNVVRCNTDEGAAGVPIERTLNIG